MSIIKVLLKPHDGSLNRLEYVLHCEGGFRLDTFYPGTCEVMFNYELVDDLYKSMSRLTDLALKHKFKLIKILGE